MAISARGVRRSFSGVGDVLAHRHVWEQRVRLEHHADIASVRRQHGDVGRAYPDVARIREGEAGNRHQQGGLARAGRAKQSKEFPGADAKVDAAKHLLRAEGDNEAGDVDRRPETGASACGSLLAGANSRQRFPDPACIARVRRRLGRPCRYFCRKFWQSARPPPLRWSSHQAGSVTACTFLFSGAEAAV